MRKSENEYCTAARRILSRFRRTRSPCRASASCSSRTSHPGNIGAAARAMLTMGLARLVLVVAARAFPIRTPWRWRPARPPCSTRRASSRRSTRRSRAARWRSACRRGRASSPAACCRCATPRARRWRTRRDGDVALVFGTEMSGLSNDELARCGDRRDDPGEPGLSRRSTSPRRCRSRPTSCASPAARRRRVARAALRAGDARRDRGAVRARRADARRDALSRSGACRSACCRGCGACSRARDSRGRRSTSCAASSRASTSSSLRGRLGAARGRVALSPGTIALRVDDDHGTMASPRVAG